MSDKTHIEWTEATWNPVTGCTKVSAGCKHCYAERDWTRLSANKATRYFGREFTDVQCHADVLDLPLRWAKPRKIFVNSMSDLFHPDVPDEFVQSVFHTMSACHHHQFQVLTKRPERMRDFCTSFYQPAEDKYLPLPNVWLGVSVEDQSAADERIPLLLQTPSAVRWVSAEPLLGPVEIGPYLSRTNMPGLRLMPGFVDSLPGVDWVVAGGESGANARPMHPDWARRLRDQCAAAGTAFLFKQWGEWEIASTENGHYDSDMARNRAHWVHPDAVMTKPSCLRDGFPTAISSQAYAMVKVGKKAAGRLLDGALHDGYPEVRHA